MLRPLNLICQRHTSFGAGFLCSVCGSSIAIVERILFHRNRFFWVQVSYSYLTKMRKRLSRFGYGGRILMIHLELVANEHTSCGDWWRSWARTCKVLIYTPSVVRHVNTEHASDEWVSQWNAGLHRVSFFGFIDTVFYSKIHNECGRHIIVWKHADESGIREGGTPSSVRVYPCLDSSFIPDVTNSYPFLTIHFYHQYSL